MPETGSSDKELVRDALIDKQAFGALIARYEGPLRRYVARISSLDQESVKDILQESFIKAYVNLNDYDATFPFSAWMYRISRNETVSYIRKHKNRPRSSESNASLIDSIPAELDIEGDADRALDAAAVREALASLDIRSRDFLVLRYFEEKSYDEISDITEMPSGSVAAYLHRAKKKLAEALKRYDTST